MKIQPGFTLKEVAGSFVIVPTGTNIVDFSAMITLNETGAFLFENIKNDITEEELVKVMLNEYDTDEETAKADVAEFVNSLKTQGWVEE